MHSIPLMVPGPRYGRDPPAPRDGARTVPFSTLDLLPLLVQKKDNRIGAIDN